MHEVRFSSLNFKKFVFHPWTRICSADIDMPFWVLILQFRMPKNCLECQISSLECQFCILRCRSTLQSVDQHCKFVFSDEKRTFLKFRNEKWTFQSIRMKTEFHAKFSDENNILPKNIYMGMEKCENLFLKNKIFCKDY